MASDEVLNQLEQGLAPKEKEGKFVWRNLPLKELKEVAKVFNHGTEKYTAPFTYRNGTGLPEGSMFDATMRHLEEIQNGELIAKDSQCLHWAHIAADALMEIARILIRQERSMEDVIIQEEASRDFPEEKVEPYLDYVCKTITFPQGASESQKQVYFAEHPMIERGKWRELEP